MPYAVAYGLTAPIRKNLRVDTEHGRAVCNTRAAASGLARRSRSTCTNGRDPSGPRGEREDDKNATHDTATVEHASILTGKGFVTQVTGSLLLAFHD
jgi:hypothetical protein